MALVTGRRHEDSATNGETHRPDFNTQLKDCLSELKSHSVRLLDTTPLSVHGTWFHSSRGKYAGPEDANANLVDDVRNSSRGQDARLVVHVFELFKKRLNDKLEFSFLQEPDGLVKAAFSPYWVQESRSQYWNDWNQDCILWHLSDRLYWSLTCQDSTKDPVLAQNGHTHPEPSESDDTDGVPAALRLIQQEWTKPIIEFMDRVTQVHSSTDTLTCVADPLTSLMSRYRERKNKRGEACTEKYFLHAAICLRAILFVGLEI